MVRDRHERRLKGEKLPTTYPFRIITKAGETTWVELNVTPFSWDNRPATLCFMANINDKKQAENALKESEDKYRSIIESIEEGYYEIDFQGNFVFLNESLERIFGRPESELIGRFIGDFTDKANRRIGIDAFTEVYETGNPRKGFEWEISHKDGGKKYVSASVSLMADSKGNKKGLRGIIRDVTRRKKAEEKLKTYAEKLRTTNIELDEAIQVAENATKAKSEFLANMSHELRTPLNAIIGFSEQMTEPDFDLEKLGEYTKIIENSGKHQLRVVNEILDISKIEAGKLELEKIPFNLDALLKDVQSTGRMVLKSRNKSDVVFNVNCQNSISDFIMGDPTKFRQVLLNFLGNATRFTKKGRIDIDVRLRDEKTLECYVEDTGIGIPKDRLGTIFEPFQQVDANTTRKYGGTGLGLDLNKKLIKLWGGEIWVDSIQGKGSKFTFTMPYISAAKPKGEKKSGESYKIDPKKDYKILIAEDNPVNLKIAMMYLKSYGLKNIINASNGVEAVSAFKEHKPDLVLMDVHMPVLDGLSATKEIREYEKNSGITKASIIALTASAMAGDREKCLNAGCNDYATKPIIKVELEKKIARNLK
jgi:PAS domain S-box-containing protein